MSFVLGYGTNGFANHRLDDALDVIAELGYRAVALTLDHAHLDPFAPDVGKQVERLAHRLDALGLRCVVETGARYLLDPRRKHYPTLVSHEPGKRIDLLERAVRIAADLGADCVSFWSGNPPEDAGPDEAWERLRVNTAAALVEAERLGVKLALEPEPGMVVERLADALRLREELGSPAALAITLDVGHCVAVEPMDAAACIRAAGDLLANVQLDDMLPGVHEHLEFGEGDLDLVATLNALHDIGYTGVAAVELPRHSHAGPAVARRSITALKAADNSWLAGAERTIRETPQAIRTLFPAVSRSVGRGPVRPDTDPDGLVHGCVDDIARTRLLKVLSESVTAAELATEVADLYRYGDDAERRGVLRALSTLDIDSGVDVVKDALRTNDIRLVAAAMGEFACRHLDQHAWRHGVLKCLFVGVPLAAVRGLPTRADAELTRMIADYADERRAAGRDVPADALGLLAASH